MQIVRTNQSQQGCRVQRFFQLDGDGVVVGMDLRLCAATLMQCAGQGQSPGSVETSTPEGVQHDLGDVVGPLIATGTGEDAFDQNMVSMG